MDGGICRRSGRVVFAAALLAGFAAGPAAAGGPPPAGWTGFHLGGHAGGAWGRDWGATATPLPSPLEFWAPAISFRPSATGAVAGVQAGYDWQFSPHGVLGVEADWSWTSLAASAAVSPIPSLSPGIPTPGTVSMRRALDWTATLRGRLGYASERWLAYVTGGLAVGRLRYAGNWAFSTGPMVQYPASFEETAVGWTAGGGLEYALARNWSVRAEYLFMRFGGAGIRGRAVPDIVPEGIATRYDWSATGVHALRFGVSYRVGAAPR